MQGDNREGTSLSSIQYCKHSLEHVEQAEANEKALSSSIDEVSSLSKKLETEKERRMEAEAALEEV